ncbi:hypothetical protein HDV05_002826 [Chytridiales sp. JEL 0842]|nr:hypothetical protein HDV05_002826 [Chytridiales sp. JEL 0842]
MKHKKNKHKIQNSALDAEDQDGDVSAAVKRKMMISFDSTETLVDDGDGVDGGASSTRIGCRGNAGADHNAQLKQQQQQHQPVNSVKQSLPPLPAIKMNTTSLRPLLILLTASVAAILSLSSNISSIHSFTHWIATKHSFQPPTSVIVFLTGPTAPLHPPTTKKEQDAVSNTIQSVLSQQLIGSIDLALVVWNIKKPPSSSSPDMKEECSPQTRTSWSKSLLTNNPRLHLVCIDPHKGVSDLLALRMEAQRLQNLDAEFYFFMSVPESFISTSALQTFTKTYTALHKASSSQAEDSYNHPLFLSSHLGILGKDGILDKRKNFEEWNPWDVSVGWGGVDPRNGKGGMVVDGFQEPEGRQRLPRSTAMLVEAATWNRRVLGGNQTERAWVVSYTDIRDSIFQRSSYQGNEEKLPERCTDPISLFWTRLGLLSFRARQIPFPLISSPKLTEPNQECYISIYYTHTLDPTFSTTRKLNLLKRIWRPFLSVIVPFYNVPHLFWFLETLQSLQSQSFHDFEVIIVNDGSNKRDLESVKVLEEMKKHVGFEGGLWTPTLLPNILDSLNIPSPPLSPPPSDDPSHPPPPRPSPQPNIPLRILTHPTNLGLSQTRNTGVLASNAPHVFFLDPDDLLPPTALEKLSVYASTVLGKTGRVQGREVGYVYSGVVHFSDGGEGRVEVVYAGYENGKLKSGNYLTSAALISKGVYVKLGGMCPRGVLAEGVFEDWDFWLRLEGFGVGGRLLREPLFWYRRHDMGNLAVIRRLQKKEGGNEGELRKLNPVAFGDLRREDVERGVLDGGGGAEVGMKCLRTPGEWVNGWVHPHETILESTRAQLNKLSPTRKNNISFLEPYKHDWTPLYIDPLDKPYIFPYNPSYFPSSSKKEVSVLYLLPWMVTGGADLYDLHILKSLSLPPSPSSPELGYTTTLITARHIDPHPWAPLFAPLANGGVWHLQRLTNSTEHAQRVVQYLSVGRAVGVCVNSRTVVGYELFEKWGRDIWRGPKGLVDVLHLRHPPPDFGNWEHRSAKVGRWMGRRVVVSRDLKRWMVGKLGYIDPETGVGEVPLVGEDKEKVVVVGPPLEMEGLESGVSDSAVQLMDWDGERVDFQKDLGKPTLLFLGRMDDQKDPMFWLDIASDLLHHPSPASLSFSQNPGTASTTPNLSFLLIGSGPLSFPVYQRLLHSPTLKARTTHLPSQPHSHLPPFLHSLQNPILLMSSKLEGLPIVVLEALGSGVPVVAVDCGGTGEVMVGPGFERGGEGGGVWEDGRYVSLKVEEGGERVEVYRHLLGSFVMNVGCEELEGASKAFRRGLGRILGREAERHWGLVDKVRREEGVEGVERLRRRRWEAGRWVREMYGVDKFWRRWRELMDGLVREKAE